jgi:hypothetical protein
LILYHETEMLDHADIKTTEVYVHPDEELQRATAELLAGELANCGCGL